MKIIRSATVEGMADANGFPTAAYEDLYENLARHGVRQMITGFMFISPDGRAMHPGQAGLDQPEKISFYRRVTARVHRYDAKIIAQLAHTGRQTKFHPVWGVSDIPSPYFGEHPRVLTTADCECVIEQFAASASYAAEAGFDAIQLHAAHGYLIHQFLLSSLNKRDDCYRDGFVFLEQIMHRIRERCGSLPIWLKLSGGVDLQQYPPEQFAALVQRLNTLHPEVLEISYGTMDDPLNIIRGEIPIRAALQYNPIYRQMSWPHRLGALATMLARWKRFQPCYNLNLARLAKAHSSAEVYVVGGYRSGEEIQACGVDGVSLCRPFIAEPDFAEKLARNQHYRSRCRNCNLCTIMVDSHYPLRCYRGINGGIK